ncbi:MAG: carboxymuconolactone decarboxylase family protein [Actinobacteria bacterium]|nr:carboxymuconolactone decarboxylase family protein [Actinomycetota bacterium]
MPGLRPDDARPDPLSAELEQLPEVQERWQEFEATVWSGAVDPVLLELCRLRVATLLGDEPGMGLRTKAAVAAGLGEDLVDALPNWSVSPRFGPSERAALAIAELFVIDAHAVTDEMCAELLAEVGDARATALTMGIALFDATSRARIALTATAGA